jgi:alanyl-tRNA synthetase
VVRLEFTAGGAAQKQEGKEERIFNDAVKHQPSILSQSGVVDYRGQLESSKDILGLKSIEQIPRTIEKFMRENSEFSRQLGLGEYGLGGVNSLLELSQKVFGDWKSLRKELEGRSMSGAVNLEADLKRLAEKNEFIVHVVSGFNVKILSDTAKKVVDANSGLLLVIVNKAGGKVNVIVASSGPHNAGEVCKRLSLALGGGGGGNPAFAIGGGLSDGVEDKLEAFRP